MHRPDDENGNDTQYPVHSTVYRRMDIDRYHCALCIAIAMKRRGNGLLPKSSYRATLNEKKQEYEDTKA
jgi:hypothetical protein